jgi:hypothetical protein
MYGASILKYLGAVSKALAIKFADLSMSLRLSISTGEWMYLVATLITPVGMPDLVR